MNIDEGIVTALAIAAASVPNPVAGSVTMFFNSSNANRLSQKDSSGAVIDLAATTGGVVIANPVFTNNTVATTEIQVARWTIPANFLAVGSTLQLNLGGQVSSTATLSFRIRIGTAGTTADALLITFTTSAAGVANAYHYLDAIVSVLTSTTAEATGTSVLAAGTVGKLTAAFAAATVNLTVSNIIGIYLVQSIAQTYTSRSAKLTV